MKWNKRKAEAEPGSPFVPNNSRFTAALALMVVLLLLAYSNSFKAAWHMDDYSNILENPAVQVTQWDLRALKHAISLDRTQGNNLSRPVANLSFALNWYWHGTNVAGYHLINLIIHLFNFLLVYSVVLLLGATPGFPQRYRDHIHWIALGASVLWAFNPIQTQAVTYIVQRMTSLATLFYLASMTAYFKCRLAPERRSRVMWGSVVAITFLLAMGTKENAATLPMVLVLIEAAFFPAEDGRAVSRRLGFVLGTALVVTLAIVTLFFLWSDRDIVHILTRSFEMRPFSLAERALTQPRVLLFYLSLLFYPIPQRLSLEHDFTVSTSLWHPWSTLPAIIFITALIVFGLFQIRKRPLVSFAILFFFLNHVVESSILPLEMVFEHRNYLPSAFLFLPIAAGFLDLKNILQTKMHRWRLLGAGTAVLVLFFLGAGTYIRNMDWQTERSLWTDTHRKAPGRARPVFNLAKDFERRGQFAQAIALYLKSMDLQAPRRKHFEVMALTNIGTIFYKNGDLEKAIGYYHQALDRLPNTARSRYNLAVAYTNSGRYEAAETHLRWLLERNPDHDASLDLMGLILLKQHRYEESLRFARRLLKLRPNHRSPNLQIGVALTQMERPDKGNWFLRRAFHSDPGNLVVMLCMLENRLVAGEMVQANIIRTYLRDHYATDRLQSVLVNGVNEVGDPDRLRAYLENVKS